MVRMGKKRNSHRFLVRRLEKMRPLGRHRRRSENNIKVDISQKEERGLD